MKADDLNLLNILNINKEEGLLHIGSERVLLIDTESLGMLRKELIQTIGMEAAKGILTRFGYYQGWKTAHSLHKSIPWENLREWRRGGGRLHQIEGVVKVVPIKNSENMFEAYWYNSYEAEQHVEGFGKSESPVCWSLVGFASGYMSAVTKKRVVFLEQECLSQNGKRCHVIGKTVEEWGEKAESIQHYYSHQALFETLGRMSAKLRQTEERLKEKSDLLKKVELQENRFLVRSPAMLELLDSASHIASVGSTILILGESGTGKEQLARFIHKHSGRKKEPFVAINCGAFPENLLESELFGFVKGAFTGAESDRAGIFEQADGGTLFLDEVGEMTLKTQVRVLRAIQEREVQKLGDSKMLKVNVRIIAATNRNLREMVREKNFREDLYYRLRVVEFCIPPLRERREEILPLAKLFQERFCRMYDKNISEFESEFSDFLLNFSWPGNIRELQNTIESAVVLTRGKKIALQNLPSYVKSDHIHGNSSEKPVRTVEEETLEAVSNALKVMEGASQAEIAKALGITPATLWRKRKLLKG